MTPPEINWKYFNKFSAGSMTKKLAEAFDDTISSFNKNNNTNAK
jgi:hypothetical protein